MDEHVSHENGLDVDIYYPRRDRTAEAPRTTAQIDRRLAQDLLDRFVAAGAQIFVGYTTDLRGPGRSRRSRIRAARTTCTSGSRSLADRSRSVSRRMPPARIESVTPR